MTEEEVVNEPIVLKDVLSAVEAVSAENYHAQPIHQLESLCMRCGDNGVTKIMMTRIPHFREVVVMSFECPYCNERNNEVRFAGELQPRGCCYKLKVSPSEPKVLNRDVLKSDSATIKIPELDFEIPPEAQRGTFSTIEGVLTRAADELQALQHERQKVDPVTAEALDRFITKLKLYATGQISFTLVLDDPAGNSYIENPSAPSEDPSLTITYYERTPEQQASLGFLPEHEAHIDSAVLPSNQANTEPHGSVGAKALNRAIAHGKSEDFSAILSKYSAPEEVMVFPATCACGVPCDNKMFVTNIPYFQNVIVMAMSCDGCGERNSELKAGGLVPNEGMKITVRISKERDLTRDVIKSDHASVKIPEIGLKLQSGTLGGLVTTVEGLITQILENVGRIYGCSDGDGIDEKRKTKWQDLLTNLSKLLTVEEPWTLIIKDGLARSFVSPVTNAIEDDHQLTFEKYKRSWDEDEDLGLHQMDTSSGDIYYDIADPDKKTPEDDPTEPSPTC